MKNKISIIQNIIHACETGDINKFLYENDFLERCYALMNINIDDIEVSSLEIINNELRLYLKNKNVNIDTVSNFYGSNYHIKNRSNVIIIKPLES